MAQKALHKLMFTDHFPSLPLSLLPSFLPAFLPSFFPYLFISCYMLVIISGTRATKVNKTKYLFSWGSYSSDEVADIKAKINQI